MICLIISLFCGFIVQKVRRMHSWWRKLQNRSLWRLDDQVPAQARFNQDQSWPRYDFLESNEHSRPLLWCAKCHTNRKHWRPLEAEWTWANPYAPEIKARLSISCPCTQQNAQSNQVTLGNRASSQKWLNKWREEGACEADPSSKE